MSRKHLDHSVVHHLVVAFTLIIAVVIAGPSEARAQSAQEVAAKLPGFDLVTFTADHFTAVDANNYVVTHPGFNGKLAAGLVRVGSSWFGWMSITDPTAVTIGAGFSELGSLKLTGAFVIVGNSSGTIPVTALPATYRPALLAVSADGKVPVGPGVNLFLAATVTGGVAELFLTKVGAPTSIAVAGTVGPGLLKAVLGKPVAAADSYGTVSIVVPQFVPAPFNSLSTALASKVGLTITRATITATWTGAGPTLGGSFSAAAKAFGTTATVTGALKVSGVASNRTIALSGTATAANPDVTPELPGVTLKKIGVSATFSSAAGASKDVAIDVTLGLPGHAQELSGALLVRSMTDAKQSGLVAFLSTTSVDPLKLIDPTGGLGSFVLSKPVVMVSTIPQPAPIAVSSLPASVRAMLTGIGLADTAEIQPFAGVRLASKISIGGGEGPLGKVGSLLTGEYVLQGHVLKKDGKPEFEISVALPTPPALPAPLSKFATITSARFFARYDATGLRAGLDAAATLRLPSDVSVAGKFFVKLGGASGAAVQVAAELTSDWANCFGLKDFALVKGTGLAFAADATGAVAVATVGTLRVGTGTSALQFTLGGGVKMLFSTAIPTVKGLALKIEATELDLLTPVKVGQAFVRAVNAFDATTKTNLGITGTLATNLTRLANADLVGTAEGLLPTAEPLASLARFKLTPPAGETKASFYVATPDMAELGLSGFSETGVKLKARLRYERGGKPYVIGDVNGSLTTQSGLDLKASSDLTIPIHPLVQLKKPAVSVTINPSDLTSAAFSMAGVASVFGLAEAAMSVSVNKNLFSARTKATIGGLTAAEVALTAIAGTAADDLRLSISVQPANVIAGLKVGAKKFLGDDAAAQTRLDAAATGVTTAQANLDAALAAAAQEKRAAVDKLKQAETELSALRQRKADLSARESGYATALADAWKNIDLKKVFDMTAAISAVGLERAALEGMVATAAAAVTAASGVTEWSPVRLHPRVIEAQAALDTARIALEVAKLNNEARAGVSTMIDAMATAGTAAIVVQSFELKDASLKAAYQGTAQTFTVKVKVNGKDYTYAPAYKLKPPAVSLDGVGGQVFESAGGVPSQAAINARIGKLDLGYGDVRLYQDLKRDGTVGWIAGKRVGAAGWGELAVTFGGHKGKIAGITYDGDVVEMTDLNDRTKDTYTARWDGPKLKKQAFWKDYPLDAMTGGWNGYTGLMSADRFVIFKDFGQVYLDTDFDPGTDVNGNYFSRLFGGHDHVYYLTTWTGQLYCYKPGYEIATLKPIAPESDGDAGETIRIQKKVSSSGWNDFTTVFGGENGVIYGIRHDGKLFVRKHSAAGRKDCSDQWDFDWKKIGDGWDMFQHVFGGEDGVIYAVPRQALPLTPGAVVGLYAPSQQRFLRALPGEGRVDGSDLIRHGRLVPSTWGWERWKVVDAGGGLIALHNPSTGRFMVSTDGGEVELSPPTPAGSPPPEAKFEVTTDPAQTPRGHVRLWSDKHGRYVALKDRDAYLPATRDESRTNGYTTDVFEPLPIALPSP